MKEEIVYVVREWEYEGSWINGVFKSKKKALKCLEDTKNKQIEKEKYWRKRKIFGKDSEKLYKAKVKEIKNAEWSDISVYDTGDGKCIGRLK